MVEEEEVAKALQEIERSKEIALKKFKAEEIKRMEEEREKIRKEREAKEQELERDKREREAKEQERERLK